MSLDSKHPSYTKHFEDWQMLRDFYDGEKTVKSKEELYLLPTQGMTLDGMGVNDLGRQAYESYLAKTVFPDYIKDTIEIAIGLMHQKEAVIELPAELEPLRENASIKGESLAALHRRINVEQVLLGRCGLLLDPPEKPNPSNPLPYIALYVAESIINWDESSDFINTDAVNLVVLDESGYKRTNGFEWNIQIQHRVLELTDGIYKQGVFNSENGGAYEESSMFSPKIRGVVLKEIPFVFVNSKDVLPEPESSPVLGLANTVAAIYRGEADYRYNLFMQAQDTLVVIGGVRNPDAAPGEESAIRTGAGSRIDLDLKGDAKYIGVGADGIQEQRECLKNDRERAEIKSGRFIGNQSNVESGKSLTVRLGAQTATLNQIALTSAYALEKVLKLAASWIGADADKVKVIPNMDFTKGDFQGQEIVNIMTARGMGAPLSLRSLHSVFVDKGLTTLTFEEEIAKITEENKKMNIPEPDAKTSTVPSQPNQKPTQQPNQ